MEKLIKILKGFEKRRNDRNKEEWEKKSLVAKYEEIADWFRPCAEQILCNGYFLINKKYVVDLGAIELYYHEEEGEIKDPTMYHINEKPTKSSIFKLNNGKYPYFKFGSFNLHQSGVDVTFENPTEKYRASFLIRSYRIIKVENGEYSQVVDNVKYDNHSTHIFDDMFYSGILLSDTKNDKKTTIEWMDDKPGKVELDEEINWRINVSEYKKYENGEYEKDDKGNYIRYDVTDIISDKEKAEMKDAKKNKKCPEYFNSGTKYYRQDKRPWRFQLKDVE